MTEPSEPVAGIGALRESIEVLWDRSSELRPGDAGALGKVTEAIDLLDRGEARVAEIDPGPVRSSSISGSSTRSSSCSK